jgi:hypothetical protein
LWPLLLESVCAFILRAGSRILSTWNSCTCHLCIINIYLIWIVLCWLHFKFILLLENFWASILFNVFLWILSIVAL